MKCRFFAGILVTALLLPAVPVCAEETPSGSWHGLNWSLDGHVLTLSGTGTIETPMHTDPDSPAWKPYAGDIYEIVIGEGITGAQMYALSGYPRLERLTLPSTFTDLAPYALYQNTGLADIAGLEYVTDYSFSCLTGTAYAAAHPYVVTDGKLYYAECAGQTALTVPDGVTEIMPFAFGNLTGEAYLPKDADAVPVTVTLPESVEIIRDSAFAFCAGITAVSLPEGLREIGDHAFFGCAHLGSLTLGEHVESVGTQAFFNCRSMETLTVMNPETALGADACGRCIDWRAAAESRRAEGVNVDSLLTRIALYPYRMDEEMAAFAVHYPQTHPYSEVRFQNGFEAFLAKNGQICSWRNSEARRFAMENSVRFEALDALRGDVNLDGDIDILDVIALNKHLLGVTELGTRSRNAADFNGDETLGGDDSLSILRYILGITAG